MPFEENRKLTDVWLWKLSYLLPTYICGATTAVKPATLHTLANASRREDQKPFPHHPHLILKRNNKNKNKGREKERKWGKYKLCFYLKKKISCFGRLMPPTSKSAFVHSGEVLS